MFDIAWSELFLIAVLALVFIGPKELPQVLNTLGKMASKLKRSADDFRRQFEDSIRDTGYEDLNKNLQDFRQLHPVNQLRDSIDRALNTEPTRTGPVLHSDADPSEISQYANIGNEPSAGTLPAAQIAGENSSTLPVQEAHVAASDTSTQSATSDSKVNGVAQAPTKADNVPPQGNESEHTISVA